MFWRRRKHSDFASEIQAHIKLEEDRLREEGLPEEDARAAAHRAFGNETAVRERFYESGRWIWWDNLHQDLRYACRALNHSRAFAAAAVLTLALGIGANTAIFSVIDAVLLRPLPYPNPGKLVMVYERLADGGPESFSPADFLDYKRQGHFFQHLAAYREYSFNLTGQDQPERVSGAIVTADFFSVLAVRARVGRTLLPEQDKPGARTVVLGYSLWQSRYGGDPNIAGKAIDVDGEPRTVVGVMPQYFEFPAGTELWAAARYAVPEQPLNPLKDFSNVRDSHYFDIVARIKPAISMRQAQTEAETIARRLGQQYKDEEAVGAMLVGLHDDLAGPARPALLLLIGAVALLLLIACVNVANILLARGATRQREIAIRGALGAGRARLARQFLTESVLLAAAGGALGVLMAHWALKPLRALVPAAMPGGVALHLNTQVLLFTGIVSLASGMFFGFFPALQMASVDLNSILKEGGRGAGSGSRSHRIRSLLVVSEIALASVLLIGAGLLIRSFNRLLTAPEGFNPSGVLSLQLSLPSVRYAENSDRARFVKQTIARIEALPGVASAGVTSRLPLNPGNSTRSIDIKGQTPPPGGNIAPDYVVASPDYFPSLRIPLISGRTFTDRDEAGAPMVAVVNQTMARRFWPGESPVGKQIQLGACTPWCEVVGMVGDVRQHHLGMPQPPAVYMPYAQDPWPFMAFVVRTKTDPMGVVSAVEGAIHSVDKDQPVYDVRAMRDVVAKSVSPQRTRMALLSVFAFVALALACIGIYGVMAYSVAQRTHEIGIRMALGARPQDVLRFVTGQGCKLAAAGIAAGLLLSLGLARFLSSLLYGVRPADATTFIGVSLIVLAVALLASYIPARRATKVDPAVALRE